MEKHGDGVVCVTICVPASPAIAETAALEMAKRMGLPDPEVISRSVLHPSEGSVFEIKGTLDVVIVTDELRVIKREALLSDEEIEAWVRPRHLHVVAATVGEDEHSVGIREILDIKHGGIEKYGFRCHFLGTSVTPEKILATVEKTHARVVLLSTIVTHAGVHKDNMRRMHALAQQRGLRKQVLLIAGGTQVTDDLVRSCGMDAGFGRGTIGREVASFIVRTLRATQE